MNNFIHINTDIKRELFDNVRFALGIAMVAVALFSALTVILHETFSKLPLINESSIAIVGILVGLAMKYYHPTKRR